jgi:hypothetical protein
MVGVSCQFPSMEPRPAFTQVFTGKKRIFSAAGNNFPRGDLFPHISLK